MIGGRSGNCLLLAVLLILIPVPLAAEGAPHAPSEVVFLTEIILLGNVAMRVGKKIDWDGPNMKATNCPEAEQYIKREYRKGWSL